ncbi:S24 family peptidase [Kytococcus sedentarius]|uniref:S24 family peptidase n=1 Tax=Kytococcus sedentarius TaxID=1276 RepID=UPI0035BC3928
MRVGLARVSGHSMEPTLRPGDLVLVAHGARVRPGRLVVVQLPAGPMGARPLGIKRARCRRIVDGRVGWWVTSDNPGQGTDSRTFGAVEPGAVVAVGLCRVPRWVTRLMPSSEGTQRPTGLG